MSEENTDTNAFFKAYSAVDMQDKLLKDLLPKYNDIAMGTGINYFFSEIVCRKAIREPNSFSNSLSSMRTGPASDARRCFLNTMTNAFHRMEPSLEKEKETASGPRADVVYQIVEYSNGYLLDLHRILDNLTADELDTFLSNVSKFVNTVRLKQDQNVGTTTDLLWRAFDNVQLNPLCRGMSAHH